MKFFSILKDRAKRLKKEITVLYYACRHPDVKLAPRIIIILTLGYALSPVDLIPERVMNESRIKADKEPVRLKRNWFFAVLFVGFWVLLLYLQ